MECRDFQVQAADLLTDELPETQRADLEAHRGDCPACRAYLADIKEITETLRAATAPAAPADLWNRIEPQLETPVTVSRVGALRFLSAVCAALLIAIAFLLVGAEEKRDAAPDARIKFSRIEWADVDTEVEVDPLSHMLLSSADFDD